MLRRLVPVILCLATLAGCGFTPLYGKAGTGSETTTPALLSKVAISTIEDREGQMLRNALLDRITPQGKPRNPRFVLTVTMDETISGLAVQKTAFATRANLTLSANIQLVDQTTGENILSGSVQTVSSFNILNSEFATLMSERNARQKAIIQLSDEIRTRVAVRLQAGPHSAE